MDILSIIETLRSDPGKLFKENTVKAHGGNELFKRVLTMTYDPRIKFGIKNLPEYDSPKGIESLNWALEQLNLISNRDVTGDLAKAHLSHILGALSERDSEVVKLIIGQSLEIGCGASTINKAIGKNFIKDTPYMGCASFSEDKAEKLFNSKSVILSQLKADGRYSNKRIIDGTVTCESRQGLDTDFGNAFDELTVFQDLYGAPIVLNGELVIKGYSRYESNGIISSLVSIGDKIREGSDVEKEKEKILSKHGDTYDNFLGRLTYMVWDFIPNEVYISQSKWAGMTYAKRFEKLTEMVNQANLSNVELIPSRVVKSPSEAKEHYLEMVTLGEEGTVIKADKEWSDGKPTFNIKVKLEMGVDMVIKGYNFGTGKNSGVISSLNVESSCGKLKTSPAGINEAMMDYMTQQGESLIGQIIEMKSNGISQDRTGSYSMLHPVFIRFRDDKDQANSLDECKEIEQMAKEVDGFGIVTSDTSQNSSGLTR